MELKIRPMSEAPLNEQLLVVCKSGEYLALLFETESQRDSATKSISGWYSITDLLRAAEIVDKITVDHGLYWGLAWPILRRIQPPVEYRYECAEDPRRIAPGEYFMSGGKFVCANEAIAADMDKPVHCYTRREVKR